MSHSAQGPPIVSADHWIDLSLPLTPVDQLRGKIRIMQDILHRMSDAVATDLLGNAELSYFNQQLTHLGSAYVAAAAIVTGVSMAKHIAAEDVDTWEDDEIVELSQPVTLPEPDGGAS